jgi:YjjG family noncanonical pyrimidine nucleotidase
MRFKSKYLCLSINDSMIKYRHLFFDLDNTIWDFNLNAYHALKLTFEWFQLDFNLFEKFFVVYMANNERLWDLYRQNKITKEVLSESRFAISFDEMGIKEVNALEFNRDYLARMPFQTRLCEGARSVLEKLSQKYEMHIITNGFAEVQHKKLENSGLSVFFKKVFVSEEIKSPKPSPEIFHHALKSCNARKKESLMIGDSWEVDIVGAGNIGMDQVFYNPGPETFIMKKSLSDRKNGSKTTTYFIQNLNELLILL